MRKPKESGDRLLSLKKNPVFVMSLGNKELFHSNFLAWCLGQNGEAWDELRKLFFFEPGMKVEREKKNFDLLLSGENRCVVVENKFKSLPSIRQLEDYSKKIDGEFPGKKIYKLLLAPEAILKQARKLPKDWKKVSFEQVIACMNRPAQGDKIVKKYCEFVEILLEEIERVTARFTPKAEVFEILDERAAVYQDLRVGDLFEKLWASVLWGKIGWSSDCERDPNNRVDYTRGHSLLNFLVYHEKVDGFSYGLQIQAKKLKFVVILGKALMEEHRKEGGERIRKLIADVLKSLGLAGRVDEFKREKTWSLRSYTTPNDVFLYEQICLGKEKVEDLRKHIDEALECMKKFITKETLSKKKGS